MSHDLKLLDRSISKVLHISNQRLTEWKGNYSKFEAQHEADQSQRERAALEQREIARLSSLADSMRGQTAKRAKVAKSSTGASSGSRGSGPRWTKGTRRASSACPPRRVRELSRSR